MQCEICHRPPSNRLPFHCTFCARETLYPHRVQLAQTLLQKESLGQQVEQSTANSAPVGKDASLSGADPSAPQPGNLWTIQRAAAQQLLCEENIKSISDHAKALQEQLQNTKAEIAARKDRRQRRQSEFSSAKQELLQSQANEIEPVEKGIRRTKHRWEVMHQRTAESRFLLCKEAALLYGLQQHQHKKGDLSRKVYSIGWVPIVDLKDLNNASPDQVTTSTGNLAHLVHLVSHYLSLRLPAEITLPHRDYPFPTIFSPTSSYTGREAPFPDSTPSQSSNNSPSASRHAEQRSPPKARPLYFKKKLSMLAKDDPVAYASFVEGITFLAWDIAWLCKTQGMRIGDDSWEEVCDMGKNLWQLLLQPQSRPPLSREVSSRDSPQKPTALQRLDNGARTNYANDISDLPPQGYFSHGTAFGYLAAAPGTEYMNNWRLHSPIRVIEKVKNMLLAERTGAEWEILEGKEWKIAENEAGTMDEVIPTSQFPVEETGVLVKPHGMEKPVEEKSGELNMERGEEKGKSSSGWMKLKNRQQ